MKVYFIDGSVDLYNFYSCRLGETPAAATLQHFQQLLVLTSSI